MLTDTFDTTFQTLNKQVIYLACAYFLLNKFMTEMRPT